MDTPDEGTHEQTIRNRDRASSAIGLELAAICAQEGFELLVAADRPEIHTATERFRGLGCAGHGGG
jgi:hypothetical protein